jgi:hypothetical protein
VIRPLRRAHRAAMLALALLLPMLLLAALAWRVTPPVQTAPWSADGAAR